MAKKALDKCMKGHDDTRNVTAEEKTRSVEITYEFIDDSFADWLFLSGTAQPIESPFQNISRAANELMFRRSKSQKRKEEALRKRHKPPLSILVKYSMHIQGTQINKTRSIRSFLINYFFIFYFINVIDGVYRGNTV